MTRTIKEILDLQKETFISSQELRERYELEEEYRQQAGGDDMELSAEDMTAFYNAHFSPVSLESIKMYIYATSTATTENLFEWFKSDINQIVDNERYGRLGWYEKVALLFRYGIDLKTNYTENPDATAVDGDFAENTEYPTLDDPEEIDRLQVVKYAKAVDVTSGVGVMIKVAGGETGNFSQLSADQYESFKAYMSRVKPGGMPLTIINEPAERLQLSVKIYFNPLLLKSDGTLIESGENSVKIAINSYLNSIDFAGEFSIMKLTDKIQEASGVDLVGPVTARVFSQGDWIEIADRYKPYSGYLKLDTESTEDYKPEYEPYV